MEKMKPRIRSLNDLFANEEVQPYPNEVSAPAVQTADEKNGLQFIAPKKIRTFLNHPFRLYDGERLDDLVESVKANGILISTIVRKIEKDENGYEYEMLAGHNRQNAAIIADLEVIPCIVKENITDEEAWIYVIETNVMQRSFTDMLPSEKAAVLALRYSKMFSQGKRNDIIEELKRLENPDYIRENSTCGSDCHKLKNRDKVGVEYSLSGRSIANYIRANSLITALKVRLDNGELTLAVSVELSYLSTEVQQYIENVLMENEFKVDVKKAIVLRSYGDKLTEDSVYEILSGEKARKSRADTPPPIKIKHTVYSKYFAPNIKTSEIERIIGEALALYFKKAEDETSA